MPYEKRKAPSAARILDRAAGRTRVHSHASAERRAEPAMERSRAQLLRNPRFPWLRAWRTAAAAASVLLAVAFASGISKWTSAELAGANVLTTGAEQIARTVLEDGTIVQLAPSSRLEFSGPFGDREAVLEGRAFFAVQSDSTRPFRIRLPDGEVEVLGTRFDLQAREGITQVAVVEGTVRMASHGERLTVDANHIGRHSGRAPAEVEAVANVYEELEWLGSFLAFQATPLAEVAAELEHRLGIQVEIADPALLDRTMTGWFAQQTHGEMIEAICLAINAHCEVIGSQTVRMSLLP